jgi:hypothetical protein
VGQLGRTAGEPGDELAQTESDRVRQVTRRYLVIWWIVLIVAAILVVGMLARLRSRRLSR